MPTPNTPGPLNPNAPQSAPGAPETAEQRNDRVARELINDPTTTSMQDFLDKAHAQGVLPSAKLSNLPQRVFASKSFMAGMVAPNPPTYAIQRQVARQAHAVSATPGQLGNEDLADAFARGQIADAEAYNAALEAALSDPSLAAFKDSVEAEIDIRRTAASLFPGRFVAGNATLVTEYNDRQNPEADEMMFRILKALLNKGHSMTKIW